MSPTLLLAGGLGALGVAIAALVVTVVPRPAGQRGVANALASIEDRYAQHSPVASREADPFASLPGWLRALALRLSPSGMSATLQRRLDLAGNPARWTPDRILAVKGLGLVVLAALGGLYGLHSPAVLVLGVIAGGAAGFFLPDLLLYNAGIKRQARIQAALPDALDMLTVCVEAGLGFDGALAQVARNTRGPLAAEFARALQEMQIGKARGEALRAMAVRASVPEVRTFANAVIQGSELGIPVARVLREQANEMRLRRRQRAEERAQKIPVKIMVPLVCCIFPALLVVIIGPGILSIAHTLFGHGGVFTHAVQNTHSVVGR